MDKSNNTIVIILILTVTISCGKKNNIDGELKMFSEYYLASKGNTENKWRFTTDTVKLWFDDKNTKPVLQIKGKGSSGKWKEWDVVMRSTTNYDSLWFDKEERAIKGYFYEKNDFYDLIGKTHTKTLRTYWLNEQDKIKEILIYWIPEENTTTAEHLKPIVDWALVHDSVEIRRLYPNNRIIPSKENAKKWKELLSKYHKYQNTN